MHFHRLLAILLVLLALSTALEIDTANALTPSQEADRLLLATEDAFTANDTRQAASHLQAARQLGVSLPSDYQFLFGKLLVQQNKHLEARPYLERYVSIEGNKGYFYRDALALITKIEKTRPQTRQAETRPVNSDNAKISLANADEKSYGDHIKNLYNTDTIREGLATHLNNLLEFYAYGDERVVATSRLGKPSRHKLQYSSRGEIITFNQIGLGSKSPFTEDRFSVYGVNSIISYRCRAATSSCWIYHPLTSQKWLQVVRNEEIAMEISKAMSLLIRDLQKNT